jgi:superfamily II DNA helicase RecQ
LRDRGDFFLGIRKTYPLISKILTFEFEPNHADFDNDALTTFLKNKQIHRLEPTFFQQDGQSYWTVWVDYDVILGDAEKRSSASIDLNPEQQTLLDDLKIWRKEQAEKEGIPVFIIAQNKELEGVALALPKSKEALKQIRGFGDKKVKKYGDAMLSLIKQSLPTEKTDAEQK